MGKVRTVQVDNRLIIADGVGPLRYLDLDTNKVHVYPGKMKFKLKYFFRRKKKSDNNHKVEIRTDGYIKPRPSMIWPKTDGFKTIGTQPNLLNVLETTEARNICSWWDGTMRPMKGHMGACGWKFDGQIWRHL